MRLLIIGRLITNMQHRIAINIKQSSNLVLLQDLAQQYCGTQWIKGCVLTYWKSSGWNLLMTYSCLIRKYILDLRLFRYIFVFLNIVFFKFFKYLHIPKISHSDVRAINVLGSIENYIIELLRYNTKQE